MKGEKKVVTREVKIFLILCNFINSKYEAVGRGFQLVTLNNVITSTTTTTTTTYYKSPQLLSDI